MKNHIHLNRREILEKIKKRQLTPEEGIELYEWLHVDTQNHVISNSDQTIYYRTEWKKSEIQFSVKKKHTEELTLIFDRNTDLFEQWKKENVVRDNQVILITPSESYRAVNRTHYHINPNDKKDYHKLLAELSSNNKQPTQIIYNWSIHEPLFDKTKEFYPVFYLSQVLIEQKLNNEVILLYFYSNEQGQNPQCAAISGFAQTVRLEYPLLKIKTIELSESSYGMATQLYTKASNELRAEDDSIIIRYKGNYRYIRILKEFQIEKEQSNTSALKENGVYLITGGAGGLGMTFAKYIAKKIKGKLVLVGRSLLTQELKQKIQVIESFGAEVMYIQADISRSEDMTKVVHQTNLRFGNINGVIHSAGVIQDSFLLKKDVQQVKEVLSPKLQGTWNLDEATKNHELDFFVLFSSITALIGNIGQSDYAYANHLMDHFVYMRSQMKRPGKSLSINWPFWKEGGMSIDQELIEDIYNRMGIAPLKEDSGLKAFEYALQSSATQVLVVEGDNQKMKKSLEVNSLHTNTREREQMSIENIVSKDEFKEDLILYIKNLLSEETKFPVSKINAQAPLEEYGIDSVMVLRLTRELEDQFGDLSKTLFFEYQTIEELATYFQSDHHEQLVEMFGVRTKESEQSEKSQSQYQLVSQNQISSTTDEIPNNSNLLYQHRSTHQNMSQIDDEIAIIGVSGRYPMANDIEELWRNLKSGKDCISEIPKERWDFRKYYDPDKHKKGKSYSKWGGFIDNVDKFDPLFFNISPRESESMDPQVRLFMETVWKTIEDAGYTKDSLHNVGVYVGVLYGHYQLYGVDERRSNMNFVPDSSFSSIANRISYHFNFHGPSMAVDTMCSSSLTAVHLACESILKGECETAIAGGVNLTIHPNKYLQLSNGSFASTDGRCRSFGANGDGYVPGEGVGSILLKPVSKAIEDGDYIYAVIKGTTVNHGGKTNGYTVPNPNAQARLIANALEKSNIDPRTISYIEAHGTGTALGDPIEITGLTKAFEEQTMDKGFCSIGSAKSNIGHLEAAAGIAGITKVLLQMKYKQLVPSIHSQELNPNIDLDASPFYIQHQLEEWRRPTIEENGVSITFPRRSGISSFGAGGSNAHIIIEAHQNQHRLLTQEAEQEPYLMVLSAKNEARLRQYCQIYAEFLKETSSSLHDIAYTLQVGREAMEERVAMVVSSKKEFAEKLSRFSQGQEDIEQMYRGNVKDQLEKENLIDGDEGDAFIRLIIKNQNFVKLAQLWVTGEVIDWGLLYWGKNPYRVSLPTYPFASESYWVPEVEDDEEKPLTVQGEVAKLHELLDVNESTLYELRFKKVMKRKDSLVTDNLIHGNRVVPSVVFLEMAKEAGQLANSNKQVTQILNVEFSRPLVLNKEKQDIWVNLYTDDQQVYFEITTMDDDQKIVCAQGELIYENTLENQSISIINNSIEGIKDKLMNHLIDKEFYSLLDNYNFHYGPTFQVIKEYGYNQKEAYAYLELPEIVEENISAYTMYPPFMDGALQTLYAWLTKEISFASYSYELDSLGKINILAPLSKTCHVHAVLLEEESGESLKVFDLFLYNNTGQLVISIEHVKLVANQGIIHQSQDKEGYIETGQHMLVKQWRESSEKQKRTEKHIESVLIVVNEKTRMLGEQLMEQWSVNGTILDYAELDICVEEPAILKQNFQAVIDFSDLYGSTGNSDKRSTEKLVLLQNIIKSNQRHPLIILHVTGGLQTFRTQHSTLAGAELAGVVKMLGAEYSKLQARTIDADFSVTDIESWLEMLTNEITIVDSESEICYRDGNRYIPYMAMAGTDHQKLKKTKIDKNKVYVITGGTRGIGMEMAKHFVSKGARKLVLMGIQQIPPRNEWKNILQNQHVDQSLSNKLNTILNLESQGANVYLYSGSLTEESKLKTYFNEIRQHGEEIGGVVHCAGIAINNDLAFINKKVEDIDQVFEPKVRGLQTLHRIFVDDPLDFFILSSSVSALIPVLGVGVSDYAAANSFMDYFAAYQHSQGHNYYLSINWPSWKEVGMGEVTGPVYQNMGLLAHSTVDGLTMLDHAMELNQETCMPCLVNQNQFKMQNLLFFQGIKNNDNPVYSVQKNKEENHSIKSTDISTFQKWLTELFSKELRIPKEKLEENTDFGEFGLDSILLVDIINTVEKRLGTTLDPSVFLEYPTLNRLSTFLTSKYSIEMDEEKRKQRPGDEDQASKHLMASSSHQDIELDFSNQARKTLPPYTQRSDSLFNLSNEKKSVLPKIAVIGIGCHFPGASNKEAFWENLAYGKSGIVEVPSTRWDVEQFYSPHHETGKSISKWGGFIDGIELFDPEFFGISQENAAQIDPLVRQFLEVSTETIRDAGYEQSELSNRRIGVFVGSRVSDYSSRITHLKKNSIIGMGQNFIGAYASQYFNFKGPNMVIDTACSSSLVSIHLACQSLLSGESEMALAGGVDILLDENPYLVLSEGRALSPDGKCHTFDAKANGFVPGEGSGAVLLKPFEKALEDGDQIYGVIDSTAVNNDGRTMGVTTPSEEGQRAVILEALRKGKINPNTISYIETHGTGTMIGDPIELKGLTKVFREFTDERQFCGVGSVKTNIGHLLSAAGIASFIKVILSLHHKKLPPTLNCETPNPRFEFSESPFYPNNEYKDWDALNGIRRTGISSFGFGGTNAHVIVSELGQQLVEQHQQKRQPLLPIQFKRKRYWLDKQSDIKQEEEGQLPSLFEFDII
ncbi:SDR family NAD(P)-dependent oxidoreductase [Gracilibacillus sp. S3-1-1]|uniref:SDR family NAD(P)-dependent oxidoreductase n=1 Tax=Gracilibacillus pellucidus TaxID=3095368 RepID=A0ACC6M8I3_9BACI|nr:SDR family NAD(P)-dependent oxidoreductase [Gracilibacillus sp. S3-1-1]MDX8047240.1 SDR family NAD(P)-dependent oxidoreductase [Gracilibacillus sp. S3-1-1]